MPTLVAAHGFRLDLLYRVRSIELQVPTLRERREDIPMLAAHFASERATAQRPVVLLPDALSVHV